MLKFFKLLLFVFALLTTEANAFEFKKINHLFDSIKDEFISKPNYKVMSLKSLNTLNQMDSNINIFHSNNKAFLYNKNNFIMSFDLPQETDCVAWKDLLNNILDTSLKNSNILLSNKDELEAKILNICSQNIDKYSRIEENYDHSKNDYFEYNIENNVLYVKSFTFFDGFTDLLQNIIENNKNVSGLILDLRQNRGGVFKEAIKTSDLFLDKALIAYTEQKGNNTKYYTSSDGDILEDKQIIILTSEHTASAAEIVSAALSEQGRAITVGTTTYGKGTVQKVYNLKNISFYLTNAFIYSPSGNPIDSNGIKPNVCSGIENSCVISDKNNPRKDILFAINMIKKNLG